MDFFIRLGHWLAHPPKWFVPLAAVVDALFILAAVLNAVSLDNETLAVASYSLIGITTCYLAFLFIRLLIGLYYSYLIPRLETSRLASFFPEGTAYRTIFFTGLSSLINLAFAGMNLFLGIAYSSIWYGSLAAYYCLVLSLRLSTVVSSYLAGKKLGDNPEAFLLKPKPDRLRNAQPGFHKQFCGVAIQPPFRFQNIPLLLTGFLFPIMLFIRRVNIQVSV